MNPDDFQKVEFAVKSIERVADGAKIRAVDIFFSHKYADSVTDGKIQASSISFGEEEYLSENGVLADFFSKFGTLSLAKESVKEFGEIRGDNNKSIGNRIFRTLDFPRQNLKLATLDELSEHLANWNFGKSFVLYSTYHPVRSIEVYLSVFIIFDRTLSPIVKPIIGEEIAWWMLTDVSSLITGLLSTETVRIQEEMALTDSLVKVVRHMVKNVPLNANLMALNRALKKKDVDEAISIYQTIVRREKLRDVITDILYSFKLDPKELLVNRSDLTTYTALIELLVGGHANPEEIKVLGLTDEIRHHPANPIPIREAIAVLTALVNIWANATKQPGALEIGLKTMGSALSISFTNCGEINDNLKDYANSRTNNCERDGEGLEHLRNSVDKIPSLDIQVESADHKVTITLRIAT
jgi:hypothetical protein